MFDTELAAAMLEAPAAFVAHDKGASRTGKGKSVGAKAAVAQPAAFATHSLEQNDAAADEQAERNGQPLKRGKLAVEKGYAKTQQGAAAQNYRQQPDWAVEQRKEMGGEHSQYADENSGEECGNGAAERSEELHGDPENTKSKEQTNLIETHAHSPSAS